MFDFQRDWGEKRMSQKIGSVVMKAFLLDSIG
jgi:hypothetical protein